MSLVEFLEDISVRLEAGKGLTDKQQAKLDETWDRMKQWKTTGVGKLSDGKPEGCFIGSDGNPVLESHEGYLSEEIGLRKDEEGFNAKPCFILGRKDNDGTFCRGIKNNL